MKHKLTPIGTVIQAYIDTPDTRFGKVGRYTIRVKIDAEDAAPLVAEIEKEIRASFRMAQARAESPAKLARVRVATLVPHEVNPIDRSVTLKFRVNPLSHAAQSNPISQKPYVVDEFNNPLPIGSVNRGCRVRVEYSFAPFYTALVGASVGLKLRGVRVVSSSGVQASTAPRNNALFAQAGAQC